jgi:hypothetical protein
MHLPVNGSKVRHRWCFNHPLAWPPRARPPIRPVTPPRILHSQPARHRLTLLARPSVSMFGTRLQTAANRPLPMDLYRSVLFGPPSTWPSPPGRRKSLRASLVLRITVRQRRWCGTTPKQRAPASSTRNWRAMSLNLTSCLICHYREPPPLWSL